MPAPLTLMRGQRLGALLARPEPLVLPGSADALTARVAERAGFEAVYATGGGIANVLLGQPDVGLTTMTEVLGQVARICDAVELPVLADIDTGFGSALNARRTVRAFERAGVAGVQIEDQTTPKRCGHFRGTEVIPLPEMLGKLQAVLDARTDPSLVVVARTDALATEGFERAVERAHAFVEIGADVIFVEGPRTRDELAELPRLIRAPLLANMVEGGRSPLLTAAELGALGYRVVLFANTALRVAAAACRDALAELRRTGDAGRLVDRMLSWEERQTLLGLPEIEALERRYANGEGPVTSGEARGPARARARGPRRAEA